MTTSLSEARAAKTIVKRLLVGVEGVSGIGITRGENGEPSVLVNVQKHAIPQVQSRLSSQKLHAPVIIEEIGVISFERDRG